MAENNTNEINAKAQFFADFVKAQSELPSFKKDTAGYNYKYMGLDQLLGVARPIFNKHNIGIFHDTEQEMVEGTVMLTVSTVLVHANGYEFRSSPRQMPIEVKKGLSTIQCIGSSETYARRYSLQSLLGICAEEDDDGVSAADSTESRYAYRQPPRQQRREPAPAPAPAPEPAIDITGLQISAEKAARAGRESLRNWCKSHTRDEVAAITANDGYKAKLDAIADDADKKNGMGATNA